MKGSKTKDPFYGLSAEERESLMQNILNTTQARIFWKDKNRRFIGVNKAFLEAYGFNSEDDVIGKTDEEMSWHPDPEPFKSDELRVLNGESTELVHTQNIIQGEVHDILASKNPLYDKDGEIIGLVGSFIDVTEQYRQEKHITDLNEKLSKALQETKKANEIMNRFLSRASHEIRTPMNAIIGLSDLALESDDPEVIKDYLTKINDSSKYLVGIINDILDINKIESGSMQLIERPASISHLLKSVDNIIKPLCERKNINYERNVDAIKPLNAVCDEQRIIQILVNILSNAVKFTDAGGNIRMDGTLDNNDDTDTAADNAHTAVASADSGSAPTIYRLRFMIMDNGCGMSEDFLHRIFQPFAQENRDISKYGAGTGLGLSISKSFAMMMGGDITVSSIEDVGSVFTVTLPLRSCTRSEAENNEDEDVQDSTDPAEKLRDKMILVAEDNDLNWEVDKSILELSGISSVRAENGRVAIEMFADSFEGEYSAILMDIQMPGMGGFEATSHIRSMTRNDAKTIPIIALSADVFETTKNHAREIGMDDFIAKPIDRRQLIKKLSELIK